MKYNELPKWAQKQVKRQVKRWVKEKYLEIDEEARESGEYVPYYTEKELESVVMEYLNGRDDFSIEYDGETDTETVVC